MNRRERRERDRIQAKVAEQLAKAAVNEANPRKRFDDFLTLAGIASGFLSWGWAVLAPTSSSIFGSILVFVGVAAFAFAIRRMFSLEPSSFVFVAAVALVGFAIFDWYIVIKPQRGKPFQDLLVQGYHLDTQCGGMPGKDTMPTWLRDESKSWQAQVDQLITQKLPAKDSQIWQGAIIVGRVSDDNMNAYQCTWLAIKVAALETIVSTEYDPSLKHQPYNGPTYWFNPSNGKVDISSAMQSVVTSGGSTNIVIGSDTTGQKDDEKSVQVTGSMYPQRTPDSDTPKEAGK